MWLKKFISVIVPLLITVSLLLLLTSPLWIGWMMEYEHNKTKNALSNTSLQCNEGAIERREIWNKLGVAIFCEKNAIKHGTWQAWDGGYMHIYGEYTEGKKHGTWKYFNALGEQWGERSWHTGKELHDLVNLLTIDSLLLKKKERKLYLIRNGKPYRTYSVKLGASPVGHKQQDGDERTPEGLYILDSRNENSGYYKSIRVSYPNSEDQKWAQKAGVNPGGAIMIHGQPNGFGWAWRILSLWNWTDGCVAVNNQDMDEIWSLVENGTTIEITP